MAVSPGEAPRKKKKNNSQAASNDFTVWRVSLEGGGVGVGAMHSCLAEGFIKSWLKLHFQRGEHTQSELSLPRVEEGKHNKRLERKGKGRRRQQIVWARQESGIHTHTHTH